MKKILVILIFAVMVSSAVAFDEPDLIFYFPFEEFEGNTAVDRSGKGHNGTIQGNIKIVDGGKIGKAAEFSTTSYIDLDGSSFPDEHIPKEEITLCAWAKCKNTGDHHAIFNARAGDSTWLIHPEFRTEGNFRWLLRSNFGVTIFDMRAGAVKWDEWMHFAGVYDGKKGTLYINGVLEGEMNATGRIAKDWRLGARIGYNIDNVRPFTGLMDELSLWKRALPLEDIKAIMENGLEEFLAVSLAGVRIEVFSPVALTVTDPLGRTIDQITSEIPSASYELVDVNGDGELDVRVNIPDALLGNYLIGLIPNPVASPTDTYTLDVILGNQVVTLAENVQVQDIPAEPYTFFFPVLGMKEGWNLISLPLEPPDTDPAAVLASLGTKYNSVWAYHPDNGWSIYAPWAPSDLDTMEPDWGYWVKMNEPGDLLMEGTDPTETTIPLYGEKWNLVGYSSREFRNAEDCMSQVADKINSVWAYDPDTIWDIYVPGGPNDLEVMGPGIGYWIKADQYCEWDVNATDQLPAPPLAVRKKRTSEDAPEIPYMIWGDVEFDGMKITGKEPDYLSLTAILKVDGVVEATCKLGTFGSYGRFYRLYIPTNIDDTTRAEIYFQVDDNLVKAAPVPPGRPGQVIRFDVTVRVPPKVSVLHQNYPNPFNPDTWIPYQLAEDVSVAIRIYDVAGRLIRTLDIGHKPAGFYTTKDKAAYWDGRNEAGEQVASGVYFYTIQAGEFTATKKMTIAK